MACYATFLNAINQLDIREKLDIQGSEGLETQEYIDLIDLAREFRDELKKLLVCKDGQLSDIAVALMF